LKKLAADVGDEELLRAVGEWLALLAEERYQDAYDFLYHPEMPVLAVNDLSADDIRNVVTTYGWGEPHPDGPFKVTPVETALPHEFPPHQDVHRSEQPLEGAWDATLVQYGGTPSGANWVGMLLFDVPLNGTWSDLTAIFKIVLYDGATVLALENIDVM